jgi:hypothetical protein
VIYVGSLSHLHAVGTEMYTMDLLRAIQAISVKVGQGVHVVPGVLIPLSGVNNAELVRRMADLDSWIMHACPQDNLSFPDTRRVLWEALIEAGVGNNGYNSPKKLLLPISPKN